MDPLDPSVIDRLLTMLMEHADGRAFQFKCGMFSVAFDGLPIEEEAPEEKISTDVRGFAAPSSDDDEDGDSELDKMSRHHRSALRGAVPMLNPGKKS